MELSTQHQEEKTIDYQKKISKYESLIAKLKENHKDICLELENENENDFLTESVKNSENSTSKSVSPIKSIEKISEIHVNENIERGLQKISLRLMRNNDSLKPINDLISEDLKYNEKISIIFEKAKSIILNLSIQVFKIDK